MGISWLGAHRLLAGTGLNSYFSGGRSEMLLSGFYSGARSRRDETCSTEAGMREEFLTFIWFSSLGLLFCTSARVCLQANQDSHFPKPAPGCEHSGCSKLDSHLYPKYLFFSDTDAASLGSSSEAHTSRLFHPIGRISSVLPAANGCQPLAKSTLATFSSRSGLFLASMSSLQWQHMLLERCQPAPLLRCRTRLAWLALFVLSPRLFIASLIPFRFHLGQWPCKIISAVSGITDIGCTGSKAMWLLHFLRSCFCYYYLDVQPDNLL